jgi:hypothetical protein
MGKMGSHMTESNLATLDPQIQGIVGSFLQELLASFPDELGSLSLTGSCVTEDYVHGKSDINSALVLREMCPSCLDKLASMGRRFGKKRVRAPLIMTPEYIERSLDVFPMEFLDIKLIHRTIHGADLFSGLVINKSLLRLQCERELKARLIHLNQGYISCMGGGRGLRDLLAGAHAGYFPLFRAMLFVTRINQAPPVLKDAVLTDMESAFGIPLACLRDVRAMSMKRCFGHDWSAAKETFNQVYKVTHDLSLTMDRISA